MTTTSGVPDLLKRFVPTPFSTTVIANGAQIALQSNEDLAQCRTALHTGLLGEQLSATIIFDPEAPNDAHEIQVIRAWPVVTLLAGTGTVLTVDCELREILGFLAPGVSATRFVDEFLPLLVTLYRESTSDNRLQKHGTGHE